MSRTSGYRFSRQTTSFVQRACALKNVKRRRPPSRSRRSRCVTSALIVAMMAEMPDRVPQRNHLRLCIENLLVERVAVPDPGRDVDLRRGLCRPPTVRSRLLRARGRDGREAPTQDHGDCRPNCGTKTSHHRPPALWLLSMPQRVCLPCIVACFGRVLRFRHCATSPRSAENGHLMRILLSVLLFACVAPAYADPALDFAALAHASGTPEIPGLKMVWLAPWGDPAKANRWQNIIAHQTEGPAGSARGGAAEQAKNPTRRGVTVWVETDGTVYWAVAENLIPTHGEGGDRNDNKYIGKSTTYHQVVKTNSI